MSFISILWWRQRWNRKRKISVFKTAKLKIPRGGKSELVVSCQVVINPFCGLSVIFCGFISHLIGCGKTINIPEILSGVHGFTGKTVNLHKNSICFIHQKMYNLYPTYQGCQYSFYIRQLRFVGVGSWNCKNLMANLKNIWQALVD